MLLQGSKRGAQTAMAAFGKESLCVLSAHSTRELPYAAIPVRCFPTAHISLGHGFQSFP